MQLRLYILTLHHVAMSSCSYLLLVLPFSLCFPRPLVPTLVYVCLSWKVCISLFCDIHTLLFFFVFLHPLSAVSHILSLRLFYLAPYTHLVISLILTNSSQTLHKLLICFTWPSFQLYLALVFSFVLSVCVFICSGRTHPVHRRAQNHAYTYKHTHAQQAHTWRSKTTRTAPQTVLVNSCFGNLVYNL